MEDEKANLFISSQRMWYDQREKEEKDPGKWRDSVNRSGENPWMISIQSSDWNGRIFLFDVNSNWMKAHPSLWIFLFFIFYLGKKEISMTG